MSDLTDLRSPGVTATAATGERTADATVDDELLAPYQRLGTVAEDERLRLTAWGARAR